MRGKPRHIESVNQRVYGVEDVRNASALVTGRASMNTDDGDDSDWEEIVLGTASSGSGGPHIGRMVDGGVKNNTMIKHEDDAVANVPLK